MGLFTAILLLGQGVGAEEELPLLAEITSATASHVAWRVEVPAGASFEVESFVDNNGVRMVYDGIWKTPPGGNMSGGASVFWGKGFPRIHAQASGAEVPGVTVLLGGVGGTGSFRYRPPNPDPGSWVFVLAAAMDGEANITFSLRGTSGVELVGQSVGDAFLHREEAFVGGANVLADLPRGVEAKASLNVAVQKDVAHSFFGTFHGTNNCGILEMHAETPSGSVDSDTQYRFADAPAGHYRFVIDKNLDFFPSLPGCPDYWPPEVWVAGADVAIPS